jgi:hypothetical protein
MFITTCPVCLRYQARPWLRGRRKAYVKWLARDPMNPVWNALIVVPAFMGLVAGILTLVFGMKGWQ